MWKRITLLTIVFICLVVTVDASICEDRVLPNQNCTMLTPALSCTNYTYDLIGTSGQILETKNLTNLNQSLYFLTFNQSQGDYIVRLCDNSTRQIVVGTEDNMAFFSVSFIYVFLTALVILGMIFSPYKWLQYLLFIPLNLMIIALLRFAGMFVEILYPNQTTLIDVLTRFYTFGVAIIYPVVGICVVYASYLGIVGIMTARKNKKEEKEKWGMD